jgi:predicted GNAT family acetyltransferase
MKYMRAAEIGPPVSFWIQECDMDEIHGEDSAKGGRYRTGEQGQEAIMTFSRASPRLIIIDHTEVPDIYRGQGVGAKLAAHAIEEARKGGWKIIPLCPFMKSQVQRHPEWSDVISR